MGARKWGVIERFRVRPPFRDRVERECPGILARAVAARAALRDSGVEVLGPFLLQWKDGEWWTLAWEFRRREDAERLLGLCEDPEWARFVESETTAGAEFDPGRGLPGF